MLGFNKENTLRKYKKEIAQLTKERDDAEVRASISKEWGQVLASKLDGKIEAQDNVISLLKRLSRWMEYTAESDLASTARLYYLYGELSNIDLYKTVEILEERDYYVY